jgi:hypothetical protein
LLLQRIKAARRAANRARLPLDVSLRLEDLAAAVLAGLEVDVVGTAALT